MEDDVDGTGYLALPLGNGPTSNFPQVNCFNALQEPTTIRELGALIGAGTRRLFAEATAPLAPRRYGGALGRAALGSPCSAAGSYPWRRHEPICYTLK